MRAILWLPVLTAVCAVSSLRADLTIVQHMDGMGAAIDSATLFKDGRARNDESAAVSLIMDLKSGEVIRLMHAQKSYTKISGHIPAAVIHAMTQSPILPKDGGLALTPAGKKDTVSGYATDEYTCATPRIKMSVWLTKAMPGYAEILKEMSTGFPAIPAVAVLKGLGLDIAALPGFPVRIAYEVRPGQTITSTVVSISSKPIADSEFEIPADYTQMPAPPAPANVSPFSQHF